MARTQRFKQVSVEEVLMRRLVDYQQFLQGQLPKQQVLLIAGSHHLEHALPSCHVHVPQRCARLLVQHPRRSDRGMQTLGTLLRRAGQRAIRRAEKALRRR